MKEGLLSIFFLLLCAVLQAQAPGRISYQAVIRDGSGDLVRNAAVGVRISILKGTATGSGVYEETHTVTADGSGVVRFEIGGGSMVTGQLDTIDWLSDAYYLKQEIDPSGGNSYTVNGTTELLSVPFALYSAKAKAVKLRVSTIGDTLYAGSGTGVVIPGLSRAAVNPKYPSGYVHCFAGSDTTRIVNVTNPLTGQTWMDRNLGASQVATVFNDAASYGDLFQWGRFADGHQCARDPNKSATTNTLATTAVYTDTASWYGKFITTSSSPNDWLSTPIGDLWNGVQGINNPCPKGYRLPTSSEWDTERSSWSSQNSAGAFASPLKLPVAGRRNNSNGSLSLVGSYGVYWSSSISGNDALGLVFDNGSAQMGTGNRALANSVRCIKDPL